MRELPAVEKGGMIWVGTRPGIALDIDRELAGLGDDLASYNLKSYHHYETRTLRREMNWKLAVDTFCETYHLSYLHHDTISPLFYNNRATFDGFGRNHRMIAARRTIDELRGRPESEWDVYAHTAIVYVLFPNTVFIFQRDHVESWHIFPGDRPDRCSMYVSLYIPEPVASDSAKRHWDNNFNLLMATVELQDFPTCEGMQKRFPVGRAGFDRLRTQRTGPAAFPPQRHGARRRGTDWLRNKIAAPSLDTRGDYLLRLTPSRTTMDFVERQRWNPERIHRCRLPCKPLSRPRCAPYPRR